MSDTQSENLNIVDEHRKMIIMTGNISDFQIKNLKSWPFIVFGPELKSVEIDYEFTKGGENGELYPGKVNFDFNFTSDPEDPNNSIGLLTHWTRFLFWQDTTVTFTRKGKPWPTQD